MIWFIFLRWRYLTLHSCNSTFFLQRCRMSICMPVSSLVPPKRKNQLSWETFLDSGMVKGKKKVCRKTERKDIFFSPLPIHIWIFSCHMRQVYVWFQNICLGLTRPSSDFPRNLGGERTTGSKLTQPLTPKTRFINTSLHNSIFLSF